LTRDEFKYASAPGRASLQKKVRALIEKLHAAGGGEAEAAALSRILIADLLDGITARRLMVLADGPLNAVPFGVLPLPRRDHAELLIDRFVVASAPSLNLAIEAADATRPANTRIAVVSDPVYSNNDRRLTARLNRGSTNERGALEPARLPYSAMEARSVLRTFEGSDTQSLSGFDATAPRIRALGSQPFKVLHFATHAIARQDEPYLSAVMLARYAADGSVLQDSRLTADDIARSGLRAELVVLSGCATGDGRELRGEGVLGLTYVFLANGSRSVVASLWPVEDASAARFMQAFYRAYRLSGRASEALRTAQLQSRDTIARSTWASFIVRTREFP
jgi:CHAT domain-containing protein